MDPLCHHHRYGYIFRSRGTYTRLYVSQKTNNYIALVYTKGKTISVLLVLKSVKIIDFSSLNIKIHSKSFSLNYIEIKPNDLLVSVS